MVMYYIYSLSIIPLLASRAIIPIFVTALIARVGPEWGWLAEKAGVQLVGGLPDWMINDGSLVILGIMALAEVIVNKSPDLRAVLEVTEPAIKGFTAFLLCFNLVEGDFTELWVMVQEHGPTSSYVWGHSFAYTWSFVLGWAVYHVANLRGFIFGFMAESDEDDDLGAQGLLSWLEDGMSSMGILFVIFLPMFALAVSGITVLGLYLFTKYLKYREEKRKVPCTSCNAPNHLCGPHCHSCKTAREPVHEIGFMGMIRKETVTDIAGHRHRMVARKRCSFCGNRFEEKTLIQKCVACGHPPFANRAALDAYLQKLSASLPKTMLICLGLSFIPVLGLIPGIIYYRVNLLSGLRCYIPRATGCITKWLVRILNLFLICLQPIPIVGMCTLPIMCWVNYVVYRSVFKQQAGAIPTGGPPPIPA